jgi:hypothetical protein
MSRNGRGSLEKDRVYWARIFPTANQNGPTQQHETALITGFAGRNGSSEAALLLKQG